MWWQRQFLRKLCGLPVFWGVVGGKNFLVRGFKGVP